MLKSDVELEKRFVDCVMTDEVIAHVIETKVKWIVAFDFKEFLRKRKVEYDIVTILQHDIDEDDVIYDKVISLLMLGSAGSEAVYKLPCNIYENGFVSLYFVDDCLGLGVIDAMAEVIGLRIVAIPGELHNKG